MNFTDPVAESFVELTVNIMIIASAIMIKLQSNTQTDGQTDRLLLP